MVKFSISIHELVNIINHTEKYKYQTNINNLIQLLKVNPAKLLNMKGGMSISRNQQTLKYRVDDRRNPVIKKLKKTFKKGQLK